MNGGRQGENAKKMKGTDVMYQLPFFRITDFVIVIFQRMCRLKIEKKIKFMCKMNLYRERVIKNEFQKKNLKNKAPIG